MSAIRFKPRLRRVGLITLAVLAVFMVSTVAVVMIAEDQTLDTEEAFPSLVIPDPTKRPEFIFPESIRTYNLSLNRFVDRFARVCMEGKYSDFRLMLSSHSGDPIVARRFESMFNALKQVRILSIDKLPTLPGIDGPVYVMLAEYDLEDYAVTKGSPTEQCRLAIAQEAGEWCIGPIPRDAIARLKAFQQAASQPSTKPSGAVADNRDESEAPQAPRATANEPASLDS